MAEPEMIIEQLQNSLKKKSPLAGKKILITAGPTYEPIDPVRFIGNHSSGKMGYALASEFATLGASVILVSGPTTLPTPGPQIERIDVTTAAEMYEVASGHFATCDVAVLAAAVADYRPTSVASEKIKKSESESSIALTKTKDIAAAFGQEKNKQVLVGFALETENEIENAKAKLLKKNLDIIVLNSLREKGAGFGFDTNKITILDKENKIRDFELKNKQEVAKDIVDVVQERLI